MQKSYQLFNVTKNQDYGVVHMSDQDLVKGGWLKCRRKKNGKAMYKTYAGPRKQEMLLKEITVKENAL